MRSRPRNRRTSTACITCIKSADRGLVKRVHCSEGYSALVLFRWRKPTPHPALAPLGGGYYENHFVVSIRKERLGSDFPLPSRGEARQGVSFPLFHNLLT